MEPETQELLSPPPARRVRWWPMLVVIAMAGAVLVANALREGSRQEKFMTGASVGMLAALLLLLWVLLLSRMVWSARLGILGAMAVTVGVFFGLVEIRGVSGDIVPIFDWRWGKKPQLEVVESAAAEPSATPAGTADWPRFLGTQQIPATAGVQLSRDWSANPPREIWRRPIGLGWSGFAVVGGRAVTQEQRGDQEMVTCYDLATGRPLWSHSDAVQFIDQTGGKISGFGPRATPTIEGDRVYTMGATGLLNCLELTTGKRLWSRDTMKENGAQPPEWGASGSPLVVDECVVVNVGGRPGKSLIAYQKATGEPAWSAGDDRASYSSPLLTALGGVRQIVILNHNGVAGHATADGKVLWRVDWPGGQPKVAQPLVIDDQRFFVSSGYGVGCAVYEFGPSGPAQVSKSLAMKAKFSNMVLKNGAVYGFDDGVLACVDPLTCDRKWKGGRYGHGQLILVDDLLLVQAESGELALVEANPNEYRELTRITIFDHKTWNTPALAGRYFLTRTDQQAVCYELPVR